MGNNINTNPVFIVGLPRSASKWIMHSLNTYSEVCIIHEMHVKRLWRRGNEKRIQNILREPNNHKRMEELRNIFLSDRIIGCFWTLKNVEYTYRSLTTPEINAALAEVNDGRSLINNFMEVSSKHYGKQISGARHPVHYIYLNKLLDWFPDARVLFLTRSMDAIARSWRKKLIPQGANFTLKAFWTMMVTIQSYLNALLAKPVLLKWKSDPRIKLIAYDELIKHPDVIFEGICDHQNLIYDPLMADSSKMFDSAYEQADK